MKQNHADRQVRKLIKNTMIPNFTSELSLSATSIVDGIVVGQFYGSKGLAAVGVGAPILSVFTIMAGLHRKGNKGNPSEEIPSLEARKEYIDRLYKDKYDMLLRS